MSDSKLTAMMLDLSRNIEKLTGVVKTNTNTNEELQKSNQDTDKNLKDTITKLGGDLKNLNFKELSEGFGDITKNIKELDFKKIGDEFKGATKSFSEIGKSLGDIKSLKDIPKSLEGITKSFSGIKGLTKDLGGVTEKLGIDLPGEKFKNISDKVKGAGGKVKDILSGGFGKKILGAFAGGGSIDKTGSYPVGEKGPEVVKLEEGNKVLSNEKLISDVLPLKKIDPKKIESEEKKSDNSILNDPGTSENIKSNSSESMVNNKGEADKLKPESTTGQTPNKNETNLSKTDIDDMKSILYRIASLLEGPLMVSSTESPFRPNSKRI